MFVVDTNLLLYAVNPDSNDHPAAQLMVEEWRRGDRLCFLTWNIIYEFLRVSTHLKVFPQPLDLPRARSWISALLTGRAVRVLLPGERHMAVLEELAERYPRMRGNIVHDMHTVALMREHGINEIRTADGDFHQFDFLKVVNPFVRA